MKLQHEVISRPLLHQEYEIEAFSETLRGEIDLNTLCEQLVAVVQETMEPAHVSLWLYQQDPPMEKRYWNLVDDEEALLAQIGNVAVEQES